MSFVWLSHSSSFFTSQGNGSVWACGFNQKGVLGLGDTKNRPTPAVFGNGKPMIKQIRGGWRTTCVLDHSDAIQCVGDGEHGQLGRGNFEDSLVLVDVIFQAKMFHAMTPSSVLWDCVPLTAIMIAGLLCFKCWLRGTNKAISKPLLSPADRDDNGGES